MDKILELNNLRISFRTNNGTVKAVRDISFDLQRGKTLAIVGESGSGKSVTSKAILGILAGNSIIEGGEIVYDGKDLLKITEEEMCKIRGDKIAMIFQDPLSSLNPIVRIGKQITEAMILKNKSGRREAKNEFNKMLALLRKSMAEATGDAAMANELTGTFDKFCIQANKLENRYNYALAEVEEVLASVKDTRFLLSKKQKVDVKATLNGYVSRLKALKDPFLVTNFKDELAKQCSALKAAAKSYKRTEDALPEDLKNALEAAEALLTAMIEQVRPDFFDIGFYTLKNPSENLHAVSIAELNEKCHKYTMDNFMANFIAQAEKAVAYSHKIALENKRAVMPKLAEAKTYFAGDFTKADALKYAKKLADDVERSIDRMEVNKDGAAYTFRTALDTGINRYFHYKVNNPREEARFARQTEKHDKKVARGKKVDWKVVPKVVFDLEELKQVIIKAVTQLETRYAGLIASESWNANASCLEIVDFMKDKASKVVYKVTRTIAKERAIKIMEEVGISEPRMRFRQYPFEFSGGMRQRIVIAIALAADPEILICDEPTTALDVTIQAQILELINKLKKERNLSVIFITHDLGVVANMADDIAVMYAGKIVEYGTADDVFYDPRHPYTWALLSSMPDLDTKEKLDAIPGTPPNMIYPPVGDAFADRNKYAMEIDFEQQPPMFQITETHKAATWLLHPDAPEVPVPAIITNRIERMKKAGGAQNG